MALRVDLQFLDDKSLGPQFEILRVDFTDAVSELFEVGLTAFSPNPDIEPQAALGPASNSAYPRRAGAIRCEGDRPPGPSRHDRDDGRHPVSPLRGAP